MFHTANSSFPCSISLLQSVIPQGAKARFYPNC